MPNIYVQSRWTRFFHWTMAICEFFLLTSGFYAHQPVSLGHLFTMKQNIMIQLSFGLIAMGLFTGWVYYNLVTRAYRDLIFKWKDIRDLPGVFKYHLFLEKQPPDFGKYNSGEKLVFTSWFVVFIFMAFTGLILYSVGFGYVLPIPVMIEKIRFYHFLGALWFLGTIPLHIYLSLTEDPAKLQAMFSGWIKK